MNCDQSVCFFLLWLRPLCSMLQYLKSWISSLTSRIVANAKSIWNFMFDVSFTCVRTILLWRDWSFWLCKDLASNVNSSQRTIQIGWAYFSLLTNYFGLIERRTCLAMNAFSKWKWLYSDKTCLVDGHYVRMKSGALYVRDRLFLTHGLLQSLLEIYVTFSA